jgi:hypothetical protein
MSDIKLSSLYSEDYGIACGIDFTKSNNNLKFLKVKKDILEYYSQFSKQELELLQASKRLTNKKLKKTVSLDDEMYYWLLSNFNSINSSLNLLNNSVDKNAVFTQSTPSVTWTFEHNLGFNPTLQVLDLNNNPILGFTRTDNSINKVTLTFNVAMSGKIYAS